MARYAPTPDELRKAYAQPRFEFPCMKNRKIVVMGGFNCSRFNKKDKVCKECERVFLKVSQNRCMRRCPVRRTLGFSKGYPGWDRTGESD